MLLEPLPSDLGDRFHVRDALTRGASRGRLRAADLARPFRGVRVRRSSESAEDDGDGASIDAQHRARALAFAPLLTAHEFFSHVTAAVLIGLPLPAWLVASSDVHVGVLAPHRSPRATGVIGHQAVPSLTNVCRDLATGLPITSPATTWAMLGALLPDVRDIVAVGDAVVRDWRVDAPLGTPAELDAALQAGRRLGVGRLRLARPQIRTRSASRPETWTRLILTDAGCPEPELNHDVYLDGWREACVDLAYPRARIAIEYEGEHHLIEAEQWARDIRRYERLAAAGWLVIRVTRAELFGTPEVFVRRVRAALAARW
jgi:hypothetical protein